ncbi:MAG: hypothetical protein NTW67_03960, partial [Candidatus Woesearchaeota archaeon]|nr:hypothetical protein [Candidatus Woesearchaeota archaeon]
MTEKTPTEKFQDNYIISFSRLPVKESYFSMPVRVTIGCQNKSRVAENGRYRGCAFCRAYELEGESFRIRSIDDIKADVLQAIDLDDNL